MDFPLNQLFNLPTLISSVVKQASVPASLLPEEATPTTNFNAVLAGLLNTPAAATNVLTEQSSRDELSNPIEEPNDASTTSVDNLAALLFSQQPVSTDNSATVFTNILAPRTETRTTDTAGLNTEVTTEEPDTTAAESVNLTTNLNLFVPNASPNLTPNLPTGLPQTSTNNEPVINALNTRLPNPLTVGLNPTSPTLSGTTTTTTALTTPVSTSKNNPRPAATTSTRPLTTGPADQPLFNALGAEPRLTTPPTLNTATPEPTENTQASVPVNRTTVAPSTPETITVTSRENLINGGRTISQPTLVPAMPNIATPMNTAAELNARPFISPTGLDRPAEAVATLDISKLSVDVNQRSNVNLPELGEFADRLASPQTPLNPAFTANLRFDAVLRQFSAEAPPELASQVSTELLNQIDQIKKPGTSELRLRLDPPELGTITIRIQSTGNELRAEINAVDPNVRAALQSQLPELRDRLEQAGLNFSSFSFGSGDQFNRQSRQNETVDNDDSTRRPNKRPNTNNPTEPTTTTRYGSMLDVTV